MLPLFSAGVRRSLALLMMLVLPLVSWGQSTLVNYDFNAAATSAAGATVNFGTPVLVANVTSTPSVSSTEAVTVPGGIVSGAGAFTANTTGPSISFNNSGANATKFFQFALGGTALTTYSAFKVYVQTQRSSTGAPTLTLNYSINGGAFTALSPAGTVNTAFNENTYDLSGVVAANNPTTLGIRLVASGFTATTGTIRIDNFQVQGTAGTPAPALTVAPATLAAFATTTGTPSAAQTYTLTGSNLTANVLVTPPAGYEVAQGTPTVPGLYAGTQTVTQTGGTVSTTVYVRLTGAAAGTFSGNVTNVSGTASKNVAVTGAVTSPTTPAITVTGGPLTAFNTLAGQVSAFQTINVSGANLTAGIDITPPTGYEVSIDGGNSYSAVVQTLGGAGTVTSTPVRVRLTGNTVTGSLGTSLLIRSAGATAQDQTVSGTVVPEPAATPAPTVAAGTTTATTVPLTLGAGAGTNLLVVVRPSASTATAPTDGTTYTANVAYGSGTALGAGFVVFAAANATSVTVTGLAASTTYAADIYSYNVGTAAGFENYLPAGGTTSFTTTVAPCLAEGFEGTAFPPTGWTASGVSRSTVAGDIKNGVGAAIFGATSGTLSTPFMAYPASVSFFLGRSANASDKTLRLAASTSPTGPFTTVLATYVNNASQVSGSEILVPSGSYNLYTVAVPAALTTAAQVYFQFEKISGTTSPWRLDDVTVTCNAAPAPGTITVSTAGPLNAGTTQQNTPGTTVQTYDVSGTGLGAIPITVMAPAGFQVSTNAAFTGITTDANSITYAPTAGTVSPTPVYVRLSGFGTPGPLSGNVSNASGTSTTQTVAVTGTLTTSPAEINIVQGSTPIASNNAPAFAFADRMVGTRGTVVFTIQNLGSAPLTLGAFTTTAGTEFSVVGQVPAVVPAAGTASFSVRFEPTATGTRTGTISIVNSDSDENPYVLNFTGTGLPATFATWDGGGGSDNSYFTPANWVGDVLPLNTAEVLLDHSVVPGAYTVIMDGGTTATTAVELVALIVNPNGGPAIELIVPSTNILQDALTLTRTGNGETALAVYAGGKVTNQSGGGATGAGINIAGAAATFFLYDGGVYLHATRRSSSGLTDNLASVGGTENGTFLFDVPTGTQYFFTFQGLTFGNLTFGAGNAGGYGASGSSLATINGNLTIEAGTSFATTTNLISLRGNLVNNGNVKFTGDNLFINGINPQTISGTALGLTADASSLGTSVTVQINNPAGLTLATPVRVNGTLQLTNGLVATTAANVLTLVSNATGGSANSFVNGPLARVTGPVAATTVFPVGKGTAYRPLTLNATAQTSTTTYTGEIFNTSARTSGLDGGLTRVSNIRYATVTPDAQPTGFSGTLTMTFGIDDFVNYPQDLSFVMAKRDGGNWQNIGRTTATGTDSGGLPVSGDLTSGTFTSFSDFSLASTAPASNNALNTSNPLPVELSAFSAQRQADNTVAVKWTTASEKNSARFEVQRSLGGREFSTIATVVAIGNSTQPSIYATLDKSAPTATLYYRLRQVDRDGAFTFSPVATVAGSGVAKVLLFPNPAHGSVSFLATEATPYRVLNQLGQSLLTGTAEAGSPSIIIEKLNPGLYLLELQTATGRVVQKFEKQ